MATPDPFLVNVPRKLAEVERRLAYIEQRSQTARPIQIDTTPLTTSNVAVPYPTSTFMTGTAVFCPVGFTSVLVIASCIGMAVNSRAVSDYLYIQSNINGTNMGEVASGSTAASVVGTVTVTQHLVITGLSEGATVTASIQARAGGAAWAANAANIFSIYATFFWYR